MTLCHCLDFICFSFCKLYLPSFLGLWIDFGNHEMFLPRSLSNTSGTMSSNSDFSGQPSILPPSLQMAPSAIPLGPCAIPSKNSNAIPSYPMRHKHTTSWIPSPTTNTGDYDLLLKCPPNIVTHPSIAHTIKSLRAQNRKIMFDPESEILKVQAMPHPLHDAIYELSGRFLVEASHHILTPTERKCVTTASKGLLLSKSKTKLGVDKKKKSSRGASIPTELYSTVNWAIDYSLGLFFEVGLSESYSDLVSDAHQWLLRSSGIIGTL